MTISTKNIFDEKGSISIEAAFIVFFFGVILSFSMYKAIMYAQHLKAYKIATQIAEIVSQRNIFFEGKDLSYSDGNKLKPILESLIPEFSKSNVSIYIEEQAYATRNYKIIELTPGERACRIKTRLDSYGINVVTSYGKSNAIYRVIVCLKNSTDFFLDTPEVVAGVVLQPGHHH